MQITSLIVIVDFMRRDKIYLPTKETSLQLAFTNIPNDWVVSVVSNIG